nr:MAG TPA: hypothetical protein [Bacteriophage sp.]
MLLVTLLGVNSNTCFPTFIYYHSLMLLSSIK